MNIVYGSYDDRQGVSVWQPKRAKTYPEFWPDSVNVRVLLDASYVESGAPRHLVVTWALPKESHGGEFTCHACGVLIGVILFAKEQNDWRVEASDLQFAEYGEYGAPPHIYLQPIGPDRFGLMMTESESYQGENGAAVRIIVPRNGRFLEAFSMPVAYTLDPETWNDAGCLKLTKPAEACVDYDGGVDFAPGPQPQYYDLLVTKRVYRTSSTAIRSGTTVSRFYFNGSKYVSAAAN